MRLHSTGYLFITNNQSCVPVNPEVDRKISSIIKYKIISSLNKNHHIQEKFSDFFRIILVSHRVRSKMLSISVILIQTTNYCTSIYDISLPTSGLTGRQDWLFVMKNNQCCVGASLLWIMDPIRSRVVMATARKTIHARPRHLGKIHNRPRFDGVFDAVTITVYY